LILKVISWFLSFIFLFNITGCYRWRYLTDDETSRFDEQSKAWITLNTGETLVLKDVYLKNSHISGKTSEKTSVEIPLSIIHQIRIREYDTLKTALIGTAFIAGVVITVTAIEGGLSSEPDCQPIEGG